MEEPLRGLPDPKNISKQSAAFLAYVQRAGIVLYPDFYKELHEIHDSNLAIDGSSKQLADQCIAKAMER